MLRIFFFMIFVSAVILILGLVQILLLRQLNRPWWQKKWIRRAAWSLPVIGVTFMIMYGLGEYYRVGWLSSLTAPVSVVAVILEICLMLSLPFSGVVHLAERLIDWFSNRRPHKKDILADPRRRAVLKGAAALVPAVAITAGISGVGRAYAGTAVELKPLKFPSLPESVEGLRIFHLSDLHLRHYITLDDLTDMIQDASQFEPDLILVTGDIADDLTLLPEALSLLAQAKAPLGAYAILGNHEYFRGVGQVRAIFDRSDIPLLIDQSLPLGTTEITLGGLDDPMTMRSIPDEFFSAAIEKTFFPTDDASGFKILMSHRPDAFPDAAAYGVNLTLAGHTHGAQIGFGGRSLLESSMPNSFLWGNYSRGDSQLYTSSGAGHWFPFRLGCPPEAPVIELTSV